jgi:hypothetical protein
MTMEHKQSATLMLWLHKALAAGATPLSISIGEVIRRILDVWTDEKESK